MRSARKALRPSEIARFAVLSLFGLIILIPIYLAVIGGFKTVGQLNADPVGWPDPFVAANYLNIFAKSNFFRYFFNSTVIMVLTVAIDVSVAALAGFALSRFRVRARNAMYQYFLLGLLFPMTLAILPLYIQLRAFGLLDTFVGVILPQTAFLLPFHILIFRGFIKEIPNELEDAVRIDGCGKMGFFLHVVVPLSRPAIATVAVLAMVASWNNFFLPLIVLNDKDKFTLPMGSMDFVGQYSADWNVILAFFVVSMVPAIAFYLYAQRHIISGLSAGAVKG
jgi:raffinose/stachyose/melibiose transport system permease protein